MNGDTRPSKCDIRIAAAWLRRQAELVAASAAVLDRARERARLVARERVAGQHRASDGRWARVEAAE